MIFCVLAFVGIYVAVLGIAAMSLNIWWPITLFETNASISLLCFGAGVILSFIVLGYIRMMGELSGDEDPQVIYHTTRIAAFLGLLATVAAAAIQSYFRITYDIKNFLLHKGAWLQDVLELSEFTLDGNLLFLVLALPLLIGIPIFIFAFYAQSFDEYVTVHYVEMGGGEVETGRSESYLPIWPTLIIGLLLSAALIFLALTPLVYLLIVPFAILLFGYPKKKRIITASAISGVIALVAVILAFTLSPATTPQGATPTEGIVYSDTGSGYCVSGYEGEDTEVVIPQKYEGKPVIAIAENAFAGSAITSITIPDSITSIGQKAFENCTALTTVSLPTSLTRIENQTFSNCTALTEITIPSSVTSIGNGAFEACEALPEIIIPATVTSIGEYAFFNCRILIIRAAATPTPSGWELGFADDCPIVWNYLYNDISEDGYIHTYTDGIHYMIQSGKATVGTRHMQGIEVLTIPAAITHKDKSYPVTAIADSAFTDYASLTEITIPSSVESIGQDAFSGCASIHAITIPSSVESVGQDAFSGCAPCTFFCEAAEQPSGWDNTWKPSDIPVIWDCKNNALASDGFIYKKVENLYYKLTNGIAYVLPPRTDIKVANIAESITYREGVYYVKSIGADLFKMCPSLSSVTLPASIVAIGSRAFKDCSALTSVTIPSSVISIGEYAFSGCSALTSITIPSSVTSIGKRTFSGCSALTSVTIPSSVTSIGERTFSGCSALTSVTIPSSVTSIGEFAFVGSGLKTVTVPNSVTSIGKGAFASCHALESISLPFVGAFADTNTSFGHIFIDVAGAYRVPESLKSVTITGGTKIGFEAFRRCASLTEIILPASLERIDEYAFADCTSLKAVKLAKGSQPISIGSYAFSGCAALQSFTVPASVTSVGAFAFKNCAALTVYCEASAQPNEWHPYWNSANCPVVWGHTEQ